MSESRGALPAAETQTEQAFVRDRCMACGLVCDPGEYHPPAFCVLVRAGFDPWQTFRLVAAQVGLDDPGPKPPLITRTLASGTDASSPEGET